MKITVKKALPQQAEKIYEIEKECFASPWSLPLVVQEINSPTSLVVAAFCEEEIVGFGMCMIIFDEVHITNIAVRKPYRFMGVGSLILNALLESVIQAGFMDITLEVRVSNKHAISVYEKAGFVSVGCRRGYYTDNNEDAIIMWLHKGGEK